MQFEKHPDSFLTLPDLGHRIPPYRPTVITEGLHRTVYQRHLAESPLKQGLVDLMDGMGRSIPGWLRREDALKLYEMAYFARGDILELGSYHGLSTSILVRASMDAGGGYIYSVDLDLFSLLAARTTVTSLGLAKKVEFICGDAVRTVAGLAQINKQFAFVFIDHSHAFIPVRNVCRHLEYLVMKGGFCLFHDYNDERNYAVTDTDYAVYQAVQHGLNLNLFELYGIYGCAALYRRL